MGQALTVPVAEPHVYSSDQKNGECVIFKILGRVSSSRTSIAMLRACHMMQLLSWPFGHTSGLLGVAGAALVAYFRKNSPLQLPQSIVYGRSM